MPSSFLHRKESVILTAIDIIDQLGIQGLSTKEIARRQGISEGTLFRHFNTKNDILIAVLDYYSKFDADIFATITQKRLPSIEAVLFIVDTYSTYYENYPAITAVSDLFGILAHEPVLADKLRSILSRRRNFVRGVIKKGQAAGEIRPGPDGEILTDIILGTFRMVTFRWRMENRTFSLRQTVLAAVTAVMNSFSERMEGER